MCGSVQMSLQKHTSSSTPGALFFKVCRAVSFGAQPSRLRLWQGSCAQAACKDKICWHGPCLCFMFLETPPRSHLNLLLRLTGLSTADESRARQLASKLGQYVRGLGRAQDLRFNAQMMPEKAAKQLRLRAITAAQAAFAVGSCAVYQQVNVLIHM